MVDAGLSHDPHVAKSHGHLLVNLAVIIPYCTFHESLSSEVSFEFQTH